MNLGVNDRKIEDVFGNEAYYIDFYQREYKWSFENIDTLLDDLFFKFDADYKDSLEVSTGTIDKFNWYYLNTYVTHNQQGKKYIVDGQQRFTSLTLILLNLYHFAQEHNLSRPRIEYIKKRICDASADGFSFWMGDNGRAEALENILNSNDTEHFSSDDVSILNIYKNYNHIKEYLNTKFIDAHHIECFVLYFLRRVFLVEIQISESNDVAMVFEVINARGEKLKPYEILKGELLGQIEKDKLEGFLKIWNDSIGALQEYANEPDKHVENFFVAFFKARYASGVTDIKEFDKDYHKVIFSKKWNDVIQLKRNPKRVKEFIKGEFDYYSNQYDSFLRANNDETTEFPFIYYNGLNILNSQYLQLMAGLKLNDTERERKIQIISKLIDRNYSLLVLFGCYDSNKYADSVRSSVIQIRDQSIEKIKETFDADLLSAINSARDTNISDPFYYPFFKDAGYTSLRYKFIRYFFARIERFIAQEIGQGTDSFRNMVKNTGSVHGYHVEHILSNNEDNVKLFKDEEEFRVERNRLGGLLLINSNVNISSGNEEYEFKLRTYSHETIWAKTLVSAYHHKNLPFQKFSQKYKLAIEPILDFNKDSVEARQKLLFEMIKLIWGDDEIMK